MILVQILVKETTFNKDSWFGLLPTNATNLAFNVSINYGGRYMIQVNVSKCRSDP